MKTPGYNLPKGFWLSMPEHKADIPQASRNIRFVKRLQPMNRSVVMADYAHDLDALAKFSQDKVRIMSI
jgi:hypothetical protein